MPRIRKSSLLDISNYSLVLNTSNKKYFNLETIEKIFAGLANRIVDIERTKFVCCPKKILVLPPNSFLVQQKVLLVQQKFCWDK